MGTRPVQGILLLGLILLAASLTQSCNKEPEPTAVDISQPTSQKPPTELWRKRVGTKPPTEKERKKLMQQSYDKVKESRGWTINRRPILLPNGEVLCVTSNSSLDKGETSKPDMARSSTMFEETKMFRLVIVSDQGKIRLHKEFRWDTGARIITDPAGEFMVFVIQDTYSGVSRFQTGGTGKKTVSALDFELDVVWEYDIDCPKIMTPTFAATSNLITWASHDIPHQTRDSYFSHELTTMDRNGSVLWKYQLPYAELTLGNKMNRPNSRNHAVDKNGNVIYCHFDQIVYAINPTGEVVWQLPLAYTFKSHPVMLPDGSMAIIGDKSHEVRYPDFTLEAIGEPTFDVDKFRREILEYETELLSLEGFLFVLSSDGEILTEKHLPSFPISNPIIIDDSKLLLNIAGEIKFRTADDTSAPVTPSRLMCVTIDGETLWDRSFETDFWVNDVQVLSQPGETGKLILAFGDDGNLYCLSESGELLWVKNGTEVGITRYFAASGDRIFIIDGGELVCYQLAGNQ